MDDEPNYTVIDEDALEMIDLLIKGCPSHRYYRGIRKVTSDCEICDAVYYARQDWDEFMNDKFVKVH